MILQSVVKLGGIFTLILVLIGAPLWGPLWAAGVLTGSAWMFINFYFLFRLLDMGFAPLLSGAPRRMTGWSQDRILLLSVLKFPVIYLAGFFILKSRFFPVSSLVAGLTGFFVALLFSWGNFYRGIFGTSRKRA